MANATKVTGQIKKFLEERGFGHITDEKGVIRGTVSGEAAQWRWGIYLCGQDNGIVSFRAFCPIKVKSRRRPAAAEYLTRANWGLNFGNFEMDWSDGEVIFRTSVPVTTAGISVKALSDLVYCPCGMMERYLAGLLAVAVGNADPQTTLAEAEADRPPTTPHEPPTGDDPLSTDAADAVNGPAIREVSAEKAARLNRMFGGEN